MSVSHLRCQEKDQTEKTRLGLGLELGIGGGGGGGGLWYSSEVLKCIQHIECSDHGLELNPL